jgi:glycosyltransferase involved in cell wall biosynthesis
MTLSILICTIQGREGYLTRLLQELVQQKARLSNQLTDEVEIIVESDNGAMSTGSKRNYLISKSTGKYVVFIDDDDIVAPTYIADILKAAEQDPDVIVFNGTMTTNGKDERKWFISKDYPYEAKNGAYYRYPNHIVPIRREIAIQFKFQDITVGEDYLWATAIHTSGLIKTEVKIDKELYHYQFRTNK